MDYFVGLDIGTDSVGWAVTDEDYNLLRLKGKTAFGSRIFKSASDCKERRVYRANRRRLKRRKYRIELLNLLFAEEITKVDKSFFARMQYATLHYEDKEDFVDSKHVIFKDKNEEKIFYKKYPTIWKLRHELVNGNEEALKDIKNIYLAIHHIIKYRGNFLTDGESNYSSFKNEWINSINAEFKNILIDLDVDVDNDIIYASDAEALKNIILNDNLNKVTKQKELKKLFTGNDYIKKYIEMFVTIVTGGKYSLSKIDKEFKEEIDFKKVFEDSASAIEGELGIAFPLVLIAKEIFDFSTLYKLLGDNGSISQAMCGIYEQHKHDLKQLKQVLINVDKQNGLLGSKEGTYFNMFKGELKSKNNYVQLISTKYGSKCNIEDFYKYVKGVLNANEKYIEEDIYNDILDKIEKGTYLRTSLHVSTSVIPHQVHLFELRQIIKNAAVYHPFLCGIEDKLIKLFKFRVPYYYGPLNSRSEYSNVVRTKNEKITPWNIEEIIDDSASKVKFMKKLINNCRYLFGCKVMPKSSLLYEEFIIRDRLNVMTVNGNTLDGEIKQSIYNEIINRNKTTVDNIKRFITAKTGIKEIVIAGINISNPFEAPVHFKLKNIFNLNDKDEQNLVEDLLLLATVYADDKKTLESVIKKQYCNLKEHQIKAILSIQTKKWAPFSRELLEDIVYIDDEGVATCSIIDVMRNTNKNFQMTLFDKEFRFNELVDAYNKETTGEKTDSQLIQEMLMDTPALMRRSVNQTLLILEDIVSITKEAPKKILVEVTREDLKNKDKKETIKRKQEVANFINALLKDAKDEKEKLRVLSDELDTLEDLQLKGKHIYLYFKQLGLDMYTGEKIKLEDVLHSDSYDLDHIIPQSLIKDDSLDNLVLVKREINQRVKSNIYPIPEQIRTNQKVVNLWKYLYEKKLISEKKYSNLIRSKEITLEEVEQFVARQINVVDYSNIIVKKVCEIKYPNTIIVFSKAQYPSFLRKEYSIAKNRDLNKAHHAVDAYLNVVCGNILSTRFADVRKLYEERKYDKEKTFNMENVLRNYIEKHNLKDKIIGNCLRHDVLVTYKTEFNNGPLYKQTIYKKGDGELIPIHTSNSMKDTKKYGGYSSLSSNRLVLVEYDLKKKHYKKIETIKTLNEKLYKNDYEKFLETLTEEGATNIQIIKEIPLNQKVQYNGGIYCIYSNNVNLNKLKLVYQNYVDNDLIKYHNQCIRIVDKIESTDLDSIELAVNRQKETFKVTKKLNLKLFNNLISKTTASVYDGCSYIKKLSSTTDNLKFNNFSLKEQIIINDTLIKLLGGNELVSLSTYFESCPKMSCLLISKIINKNEVYLLHESPTGLYSRKERI